MREKIMTALEDFHRTQGVIFTSKKDATDYFRGLTTLIETLIDEAHPNEMK